MGYEPVRLIASRPAAKPSQLKLSAKPPQRNHRCDGGAATNADNADPFRRRCRAWPRLPPSSPTALHPPPAAQSPDWPQKTPVQSPRFLAPAFHKRGETNRRPPPPRPPPPPPPL